MTGLLTSGLPLAGDYTIPEHVQNRPAPPPATEEQPFGYRFREVLQPGAEPVISPVYDPEHQVTRSDGKLPVVKMGEGGGTWYFTPKITYKYVDGVAVADFKYDLEEDD